MTIRRVGASHAAPGSGDDRALSDLVTQLEAVLVERQRLILHLEQAGPEVPAVAVASIRAELERVCATQETLLQRLAAVVPPVSARSRSSA